MKTTIRGTSVCLICIFSWVSSANSIAMSYEANNLENQLISLEKLEHKIQLDEISSWNHVPKQPDNHRFLKQAINNYEVDISTRKFDSQINIQTLLLRKLADWDKQHSNGIKFTPKVQNMTFSHFSSLEFEIRMRSSHSFIPSFMTTKQYYHSSIINGVIKEAWLDELMSKPPVMKITFFGEGHDNQEVASPMAKFNYTVDRFDNTLSIKVTPEMLQYYWEKNYSEIPVEKSVFSDKRIRGILITINTANDKTIRSYLNEQYKENFPSTIQEMYIEVDLNINNPRLYFN